jgi:hypothetical protein
MVSVPAGSVAANLGQPFGQFLCAGLVHEIDEALVAWLHVLAEGLDVNVVE